MIREWPTNSNRAVDIFARDASFNGEQSCSQKMSEKKYYAPPVEKTHVLGDLAEAALRKNILILDDDAALADLTRKILEENGYAVETVSDGVQA